MKNMVKKMMVPGKLPSNARCSVCKAAPNRISILESCINQWDDICSAKVNSTEDGTSASTVK
jgi:hypothetical protein